MQTLTRIPALLITLSLVACGGGGPAAAGTWKLDTTATLEANESSKAVIFADVPEEGREAAEKMFDSMFSQMDVTMTLADDGTVTGIARMPNPMTGEATEQKTTGTWSADGDQVTIETKEEGSGKEETIVATLSGDTLSAEVPGDGGPPMTIVFAR